MRKIPKFGKSKKLPLPLKTRLEKSSRHNSLVK
jgi:hypothetical protein